LKVDVCGYLDVEAEDGDSSEEEAGDAYDEENKHTATFNTVQLSHPTQLGSLQTKAWIAHLLSMGYELMKTVR
jgi:hypothetical protein